MGIQTLKSNMDCPYQVPGGLWFIPKWCSCNFLRQVIIFSRYYQDACVWVLHCICCRFVFLCSVWLSVLLSCMRGCPAVVRAVCLYVMSYCLSVFLFDCLSVFLFACLSFWLCVLMSCCLFVCMSFWLFFCLCVGRLGAAPLTSFISADVGRQELTVVSTSQNNVRTNSP